MRFFSLRAVVALANALAFHWTVTPPNPPVAEGDLQAKEVIERTVLKQVFFLKTFVWGTAVMEVISSVHNAPGHDHQSITTTPPVFLLGALMCVAGSSLRLWCFKTLGKMFDFQPRIHVNHQLITSGPYTFIRHPSYAGWFLMALGTTLVTFAPNAPLREYVLVDTATTVAGAYWCIQIAVLLVLPVRRMNVEDDWLRQRFGEEWDTYAERVPYRLVPGIY
ncbi:hypothetical protein ONZ45_g6967 [Pleurotus djamor]|nr:hypothetical protein ONZ45_g6967 [Pleurotus djamor]